MCVLGFAFNDKRIGSSDYLKIFRLKTWQSDASSVTVPGFDYFRRRGANDFLLRIKPVFEIRTDPPPAVFEETKTRGGGLLP